MATESNPIFCGQPANIGRVVVEPVYPGEGFATIRCGGTEILVGYTLLTHVVLRIDGESSMFAPLSNLQNALHSITAEASQGHK